MRQPLQPVPFGAEERRGNLERLASDTFDVLVVGGGITGAAVARDVALRGLHVGLVEKGDYASGTSSRSSQLIHGGLRYLEHFDFGLVFEALRERQILIRTAPHLISPQTFLFAAYRGDRTGRWRVSQSNLREQCADVETPSYSLRIDAQRKRNRDRRWCVCKDG